jgi:hypothetical protein
MTVSVKTSTVGNGEIRPDQDNLAVGVGKAEDKDLRDDLADLSWRKIHDRCDLPAGEAVGCVVAGNLRGAFFLADRWTEVDPKCQRRLARARVRFRFQDRADANIDPRKIVVGNRHASDRASDPTPDFSRFGDGVSRTGFSWEKNKTAVLSSRAAVCEVSR